MFEKSTLRNRFLAGAVIALLVVAAPAPAHATSKDIIQLQTQVQQLLDMVQRLQTTLDTRFAVMQNLVQQTSDSATQMSAAVSALQKSLANQSDATNGKLDATSGQIQSLNDSVDELKTRINKLDKSIQDLQTQVQSIQTPPPSAAPAATPAGTMAQGAMPATGPAMAPAGAPGAAVTPSSSAPAANQAPPLNDTFQAALGDFNAAKYTVASGEFQDVIQYYPLDELAGQAQFYLGEIAYRNHDYESAIKAYNDVLEGFPGNPRAPTAQLHKAMALLKMDQKSAAIHELRLLIQRHPQTPEAAQARTRLRGMGARISAK